MYIINFIRGFFMALADSVPGVSGGTIAFLLGFYDEFLDSLNSLLSRDSKKDKIKAVRFLIKLGFGWITGFILAVLFLSSLFENNIYRVSSLFIGFIVASFPLIIKEEKEALKGNYINLIFNLLGIVLVTVITYFNPVSSSGGIDISLNNFSIGLVIYVFLSGLIAISAMVLPGISGSTLLLIFGLYTSVITGIKEILSLNFSLLPMMIVLALGILTGIVTTIKGIRILLKNHRPKMIYFILGLMIGSIYAVINGPTTLEVYHPQMNFQNFSIVFFLIGVGLILALEKVKTFLSKR